MGKARKVSEEDLKDIRTLYEGGTSLKTIAKSFGVSVPTAGRYVRLAGGTVRGRGRPKGSTKSEPVVDLAGPIQTEPDNAEPQIQIEGKPAVANMDW